MAELTGADKVMDYTARHFEAGPGNMYTAWNPNDGKPPEIDHGIAFGMIQFNQRVGSLPTLFVLMRDDDPVKFNATFGPYASELMIEDWVRTADFNFPGLKDRLIAAGSIPVFQQSQRKLAKSQYYDKAVAIGKPYGLDTEKSIACLFDSCVQMGDPKVASLMRRAAQGGGTKKEIRQRFADAADAYGQTNRRNRILQDAVLLDWPPSDQPPASQSPVTVVAAAATSAPTATTTATTPAAASTGNKSSQDRNTRLDNLKTAVSTYVSDETTRIDREVKILKAVLDGRLGGAGIQAVSIKRVSEVAFNDLQGYLDGA